LILTIILTIKYKLLTSLAGEKLSYTDSLNKNSQQIAFITQWFSESYQKTPATPITNARTKVHNVVLEPNYSHSVALCLKRLHTLL